MRGNRVPERLARERRPVPFQLTDLGKVQERVRLENPQCRCIVYLCQAHVAFIPSDTTALVNGAVLRVGSKSSLVSGFSQLRNTRNTRNGLGAGALALDPEAVPGGDHEPELPAGRFQVVDRLSAVPAGPVAAASVSYLMP